MIDKLSKYILPVLLFIVTNLNVSVAQPEVDALSVSVTDISYLNNSDTSKYEIKLSENNSVSGKAFSNTLSYPKPRAGKKTIKGMLIGAGVGSLAIGIAAAIGYEECESEEMFGCLFHPANRGEAFGVGALVGGIIGGVTGIFIGAIADSKNNSRRRPSFDVSLFHPMKFQPSKRLSPTATLKINLK